jgi:hypothetical protein
MRHLPLPVLPTFVCWLLAVAPLAAQQVTTSLSPKVVGPGQAAEFSITYEGPQASFESVPEIRVPGIEVVGPQSQSMLSSDNGVTTYRRELMWQLFSAQPGRYVIPSMPVGIMGQEFQTQEVVLEVKEGATPEVSLDPFLKLNVGKQDLYVGEVTSIAITAFFHHRTQLRNYDHPKLPRENFVVKRFPSAGPAAMVEMHGERYVPIQFTSALSAIKEGDLDLGPATLDCMVDFPASADDVRNRPRGFPPSFFQRMVTRQFAMKSDILKVRVKPLPAEGRPADFAGAVGRFSLVTRSTQPLQQLHVGDPISLDLFVTGQGNFDSIPPALPDPPDGWKLYPAKITQENRSSGLQPGAQVYNQVIVPTRMTNAIPAFQFSYFDPDQEKYQVARSAPIPLTLLPDDPGIDPRTGEAPTRDFSFAEATIPEERLADILTVRPGSSRMLSLTTPARDEALTWALQAIPAAIVLALAGVGMQRRARERAVARQRARLGQPRSLQEIRRDLKRSGLSRREFYSLAREYANAAAFHRSSKADPSASAASDPGLDQVLARQGYYSYSGDDADAAAPVTSPERKEVMAVLEHAAR